MTNNKPNPSHLSNKTKAAIRATVHTANDPDDQAARAAGLDHHAITRDAQGKATGWASCLCDIGTEHDA